MSSETKWTKGEYLIAESCVYALNGKSMVTRFMAHVQPGLVDDGRTSHDECVAVATLFRASPKLYDELAHLVRLLEPMERDGTLNVPGLATLNGARTALASARGEG